MPACEFDVQNANADEFHDLIFRVISIARDAAEERNNPRLADDRSQIVLHSSADACIAIEIQRA